MISVEFLSSMPCGLHKVPLLSVISYASPGIDSCVSRVFWSHLMSLHLFPLRDAICLPFPVSSLWATVPDNNHFTPDTLKKFTTKPVLLNPSQTWNHFNSDFTFHWAFWVRTPKFISNFLRNMNLWLHCLASSLNEKIHLRAFSLLFSWKKYFSFLWMSLMLFSPVSLVFWSFKVIWSVERWDLSHQGGYTAEPFQCEDR